MNQDMILPNGNSIPRLGLGTWKSTGGTVAPAVKYAIEEAGYRHIDCAPIYRNEKEVGEAFAEVVGKAISREDLFVTSKLWNTDHRAEFVEEAVKQTLSDLHLDYLDLYLMHWGIAFPHTEELEPVNENGRAVTDNVQIQETWQAMEQLVEKGLVKAIGTANFTTMMLVDLFTYAKIKPVMNQIELHPYNTQEEMVAFCRQEGIAVTAYSPLGRQGADKVGPRIFDDEVVKNLAKKYNKTPGQILLNWGLMRGTVVIPKSVTPERIKENAAIFDFELSKEDRESLSALNKNYRFVNPNGWWNIPYFV